MSLVQPVPQVPLALQAMAVQRVRRDRLVRLVLRVRLVRLLRSRATTRLKQNSSRLSPRACRVTLTSLALKVSSTSGMRKPELGRTLASCLVLQVQLAIPVQPALTQQSPVRPVQRDRLAPRDQPDPLDLRVSLDRLALTPLLLVLQVRRVQQDLLALTRL